MREFLEYYFFENKAKDLASAQKIYFEQKNLSNEDKNAILALSLETLSFFNVQNLYDLFSQIKNEAEELPTLVIYLPFKTDEAAKNKIGLWVRGNLNKKNLLVDFKYEPSLSAGPAFSYGGIYKDFSLREKLIKNKEEIKVLISKYLN